ARTAQRHHRLALWHFADTLSQGRERNGQGVVDTFQHVVVDFFGLTYVQDDHGGLVLDDPFRLHFRHTGEGQPQVGPVGLGWQLAAFRLATAQVVGQRLVDLLRVRQLHGVHVKDEVTLVGLATHARIVALFLADGRLGPA